MNDKRAVSELNWNRPTNLNGLQAFSAMVIPQMQKALPAYLKNSAERMVRCLFTECSKSPKLLDCKPVTLFGALIQVGQLGLELGGPAGQAYLLPFKDSATLVIGYKGFIQLAHRSGCIRRITPRIVRESDLFEVEYGTNQAIVHRPKFDDSPVVGYYTTIEMANGGTDFEFMTKAQAAKHRDTFALSQKGPWSTNFDEMALKTTIRKIAKRMPVSTELVAAASLDELGEIGESQRLEAVILGDPVSEEEDLQRRLEDAKTTAENVK